MLSGVKQPEHQQRVREQMEVFNRAPAAADGSMTKHIMNLFAQKENDRR
jgi:hypothetical protein